MNKGIYDSTDTICAISTPGGVGGIAIIRVSGPDALAVVDKLWHGKRIADCESHTVHLGRIADFLTGDVLDEAVATVFRGPHSFTGQDVVELGIHGSTWIQGAVLQALTSAGARLALPGEFTQRAYINGKLDLVEAEAVGDLIASQSRSAHRLALSQLKGSFSKRIAELRKKLIDLASLMELELDFAEEEVEFASRDKLKTLSEGIVSEISKLASSFKTGNAIKRGIPIAILGATNAGKSSLLNQLLEEERAIVSNIHGTTRDVIEDTTTIGDYLVRFMDTAGLRQTEDVIERLGIERSYNVAEKASIVLYMIDGTDASLKDFGNIDSRYVFLINKRDISEVDGIVDSVKSMYPSNAILEISTYYPEDIDAVRNLVEELIKRQTVENGDFTVTNARHAEALEQAANYLKNLLKNMANNFPTDLLAQDLRDAIQSLGAITGEITTDNLLENIFQNFCIGK